MTGHKTVCQGSWPVVLKCHSKAVPVAVKLVCASDHSLPLLPKDGP
jgi:hypothetical protein